MKQEEYKIKLNSSNHITIYPVEEVKIFSMQDMIDYGKKLLELEKSKNPVEEKMVREKALVKRCTCPFENDKSHWEDRDMDGYDDTFVEAKV